MDRSLPAGTVDAAYRDFLDRTGYSTQGLVEVSYADAVFEHVTHPHAWFERRERDIHDIWHIPNRLSDRRAARRGQSGRLFLCADPRGGLG